MLYISVEAKKNNGIGYLVPFFDGLMINEVFYEE